MGMAGGAGFGGDDQLAPASLDNEREERGRAAGSVGLQSCADSMLASPLPSSHMLASRDVAPLLSVTLPRQLSKAETQLERRESLPAVPMHSDDASSLSLRNSGSASSSAPLAAEAMEAGCLGCRSSVTCDLRPSFSSFSAAILEEAWSSGVGGRGCVCVRWPSAAANAQHAPAAL
jgi:hypothetical protein